MGTDFRYTPINAYIYLYHTDEYFILPQFPESINDSLQSQFASQSALSRTAPVFSYSYSGPRTVQFNFNLHRDMMNGINAEKSNVRINAGDRDSQDIITSIGDDYIDILVKKLQAIALPRYYSDSDNKGVTPPRVAIRFGDEIFVKGIVQGGITLDYRLPLIKNDKGQLKYAVVNIGFTVTETTPYDADSVGRLGSFRGLTSGLQQTIDGVSSSGKDNSPKTTTSTTIKL